jgi:hypothetical protein
MQSWIQTVEQLADIFEKKYGSAVRITNSTLFASFEVGCLLVLEKHYRGKGFTINPRNLNQADNSYRHLTSPNGNPANFSYLLLERKGTAFELRQQVRIQSHIDTDIQFTPDLIVLESGAHIKSERSSDYASGKRPFFFVSSTNVVAAHECKAMAAFPELMISFLGMALAGHSWYPDAKSARSRFGAGHLQPTLFIGGAGSARHNKMATALAAHCAINVAINTQAGHFRIRGLTGL